jgi:hypothetical protein
MRPTVAQALIGLALSSALAGLVALPGQVVVADESPAPGLVLHTSPATTVVRAAALPPPVRKAKQASRPARARTPKVSYPAPAPPPAPPPAASTVRARATHASRPKRHPKPPPATPPPPVQVASSSGDDDDDDGGESRSGGGGGGDDDDDGGGGSSRGGGGDDDDDGGSGGGDEDD